MDSLTVPIGLTPKIEEGKMPDLNSMVIQELQYSFMARQYNLFEEEINEDDDFEIPAFLSLFLSETRFMTEKTTVDKTTIPKTKNAK